MPKYKDLSEMSKQKVLEDMSNDENVLMNYWENYVIDDQGGVVFSKDIYDKIKHRLHPDEILIGDNDTYMCSFEALTNHDGIISDYSLDWNDTYIFYKSGLNDLEELTNTIVRCFQDAANGVIEEDYLLQKINDLDDDYNDDGEL